MKKERIGAFLALCLAAGTAACVTAGCGGKDSSPASAETAAEQAAAVQTAAEQTTAEQAATEAEPTTEAQTEAEEAPAADADEGAGEGESHVENPDNGMSYMVLGDGETGMSGAYSYQLMPKNHDSADGQPTAWDIEISDGIDQTFTAEIDPDSSHFPKDGTGVLYETDADFDGKTDLLIYRGTFGTHGVRYFDCYLNRDDKFVRCEGFEEIPDAEVYADAKMICGTLRDGAAAYTEYTYRIDGTKAVRETETRYVYDEKTKNYLPEGGGAAFTLENADFDRILSRCSEILTAEEPDEIRTDEDEVFEALFEARIYSEPEEALKKIGYIRIDLNDDGTDELLIADTQADSDAGIPGNRILAAFAKYGRGSRTLFYGWSRNKYYLLNDGYFINEGSSGASSFGFGTFRIDGEKPEVVWDNFYFSEQGAGNGDIVVYCSREGEPYTKDPDRPTFTADWLFNAETEAENDAYFLTVESFAVHALPVSVCTEEQDPDTARDMDWTALDDPEGSMKLIFKATEAVTEFRVCRLSLKDTDSDGNPVFDSEVIYEPGDLTPESPRGVLISMPGDLPSVGVSFKDAEGKPHQLVLGTGGFDGSLTKQILKF